MTAQERWEAAEILPREEMVDIAHSIRPMNTSYVKTLFKELVALDGECANTDRLSLTLRSVLADASDWYTLEGFPHHGYCGSKILRTVGKELFPKD